MGRDAKNKGGGEQMGKAEKTLQKYIAKTIHKKVYTKSKFFKFWKNNTTLSLLIIITKGTRF